ncbi:MAG TPA: ROK family glucokinase [Marmoricola sp.]
MTLPAPPAASGALTIGIDIGGTKTAGAVVDASGAMHAQARTPTLAADPRTIEDTVVSMVAELGAGRDIAAVGVAAAGFVDETRSIVHYAPNISWRQEPFRDRLQERLGLPVVVENDANAAGWAEFRFGAGQHVRDQVTITIGTGVGGAIVSDGRLLRGGFGAAGELGHLRVVPDGLACGCGSRGCIEQYASGRALQRFANEIADAGGEGLATRRALRGCLDGSDIAELVAAGDSGALEATSRLGTWVGQLCASLAAVLDPRVFVIGGGVAQLGDPLLGPIRAAFLAALPARGHHPEPEFRAAELANDAGMVGVADLARVGP